MMRAFDLNAALAGGKVVTRDGVTVYGLHRFEGDNDTYCIYGVLYGSITTWDVDGRFIGDHEEHLHDLFMAPITREAYINVYMDDLGRVFTGPAHPSMDEALAAKWVNIPSFNYIKTILIHQWEE